MKPFISLFLSTKNYEIWLKIDRDMGKRMKTYLPSLFHVNGFHSVKGVANLCYYYTTLLYVYGVTKKVYRQKCADMDSLKTVMMHQ